MPQPALPDTLGPYRVTARLGTGGMATVYRARPLDGGPDVAIKVLQLHRQHQPNVRRRFEREARALMQLRHPHILPVFDFGEDRGVPYLVMRLLSGPTLADRIAGGPLPLPDVARMTQQIGSTLDYAHARGVIHRDIKPQNILFDEAGMPFLADFGVAQFQAAGMGTATTSGDFIGTATYASPEQYEGRPLTRASDLYALAVVVFEMVTGQPPFTGPTALAIMQQHRHAEPPNPLSANPHLPLALHTVLQKGLAKLPAGRYRSARAFSAALNAALDVLPTPLSDPDDTWLHDAIEPVQPDLPRPTSPPDAPETTGQDVGDNHCDHLDHRAPLDSALLLAAPDPFTGEDEPPDPVSPDDDADDPAHRHVHPPPEASQPLRPLPRRARSGEAVPRWMRWAVYGSIAASSLAIVIGVVLIIQHLTRDSVTLTGPRSGLTLGISLQIPAGWDAAEGPLTAPTGDPATGIMLTEGTRGAAPASDAAMILGVRRLDAAEVFRVPPVCQPPIATGPRPTFACMARQGHVIPTYRPFGTESSAGALLPGTLPPTRASYPMVLLPDSEQTWLAIMIIAWQDTPHPMAILEAVAASVRPLASGNSVTNFSNALTPASEGHDTLKPAR